MDGTPTDRDLAAIGLLQDPVRRALYEHVVAAGGEVSRNQAAEAAGVGRGLAAFHLDKLVEAGLLEATFRRLWSGAVPGPAGRPSCTAGPPARSRPAFPPRTYETAAHLLAETVEQTGPTWSCRPRPGAPASGRPPPAAPGRPAVERLLAARGYEPYRDGAALRLRNCPFANLSGEFPVLVCAMNLSLIEGLLEGTGGRRGAAVRTRPRAAAAWPSLPKDNQD